MVGQSRINLLQVIAGTNTVYTLAKEHKVKTAFGTDLLFSSAITERQGLMLTHLTRWYDNADILRWRLRLMASFWRCPVNATPTKENWG
jgi:hypothetical protein